MRVLRVGVAGWVGAALLVLLAGQVRPVRAAADDKPFDPPTEAEVKQTLEKSYRETYGRDNGLAKATKVDITFGPVKVGELDAISHAMDVSVGRFTRMMTPWGPLLNLLPLPSNVRFRRARRRLLATVDRFIAEHRAAAAAAPTTRGPATADLLSMLIRATDAGAGGDGAAGMTDEQLRSECVTLFTAGHETTANALAFAWYLLATHPEAERRFHAEVDTVLAGGRAPAAADLDVLAYTRAVFAEAMRLYPPAWVLARQVTTPVDLAGYRVPAQTIVVMSPWVTHRDARWWPDPARFDPGRWLPGGHAEGNATGYSGEDAAGSESRPGRPRYAYFPFGGGPRSCIGEAFAWAEGVLVLAAIGQQWRLRLADPDQPLALLPSITLRPQGGLPMVARRRDAGESG